MQKVKATATNQDKEKLFAGAEELKLHFEVVGSIPMTSHSCRQIMKFFDGISISKPKNWHLQMPLFSLSVIKCSET